MPKLNRSIPKYRKHKASGQAIVTLNGKDVYLGPHGSKASRDEYDRVIGEWIASGRQLAAPDAANDITLVELIARYWKHVQGYYVKHGEPTGEQTNIRNALRHIKRLYGQTRAADFGPLALKAVREAMIGTGNARTHINKNVSRIRQMFRWAVENEILSPSVYHGLQAVPGLRRGRTEAAEPERIRPVYDEYVEAVQPHVSRQIWAMVQIQRLTGMRPGEVVLMRGCDIDTTGDLWEYRPTAHKTEHFGRERIVPIGPKARAIIKGFMKTDFNAYLFSPADVVEDRHQRDRAKRMTKVQPSQVKRAERARKRAERGKRRRAPGDRYDANGYRRAIARACDAAFPAPDGLQPDELKQWQRDHRWHPNQLRHSRATELRKKYGVEVARAVLGHSSAATTEIYAEMDTSVARKVAAEVG